SEVGTAESPAPAVRCCRRQRPTLSPTIPEGAARCRIPAGEGAAALGTLPARARRSWGPRREGVGGASGGVIGELGGLAGGARHGVAGGWVVSIVLVLSHAAGVLQRGPWSSTSV
ncbi:unnamed protein product, partial [Urochloa humidicola]